MTDMILIILRRIKKKLLNSFFPFITISTTDWYILRLREICGQTILRRKKIWDRFVKTSITNRCREYSELSHESCIWVTCVRGVHLNFFLFIIFVRERERERIIMDNKSLFQFVWHSCLTTNLQRFKIKIIVVKKFMIVFFFIRFRKKKFHFV